MMVIMMVVAMVVVVMVGEMRKGGHIGVVI